jgi:hypothetical protein
LLHRTLRGAVRVGSDAPTRLETIRALVDLGAALRRESKLDIATRQELAEALSV